MESFALGLPQMGCLRKCVIFDDARKSFSTRLTWKTTKRLKAAPFIKMGFEGMLVVSSRVYQLLNILEFNSSVMMKDEGGRILLLSEGATIVMFGRLVLN